MKNQKPKLISSFPIVALLLISCMTSCASGTRGKRGTNRTMLEDQKMEVLMTRQAVMKSKTKMFLEN